MRKISAISHLIVHYKLSMLRHTETLLTGISRLFTMPAKMCRLTDNQIWFMDTYNCCLEWDNESTFIAMNLTVSPQSRTDHAGNPTTGAALTWYYHYNDVIMSTMASQITSLTIVYSNVYSRRRSKKASKLRVTGLYEGNSPVTGEFPHNGQ